MKKAILIIIICFVLSGCNLVDFLNTSIINHSIVNKIKNEDYITVHVKCDNGAIVEKWISFEDMVKCIHDNQELLK